MPKSTTLSLEQLRQLLNNFTIKAIIHHVPLGYGNTVQTFLRRSINRFK
ncbi:hypothetical protein [Loigolactobacillus backii]|nr:hypothetical protein [Loigolactobacillus backii]